MPARAVKPLSFLFVCCAPDGAEPPTPAVGRTALWRELRVDIGPDDACAALDSLSKLAACAAASVDALYCADTLEQLHDDDLAAMLAQFRRVLKPDGYAVISSAEGPAQGDASAGHAQDSAGAAASLPPPYPRAANVGTPDGVASPAANHAGSVNLTALLGMLQRAGFPTVAGKRRAQPRHLWVVASKCVLAQTDIAQRAARLLPCEPPLAARQLDDAQLARLRERFGAGDFAGVAAASQSMLDTAPDDGRLWGVRGAALLMMGQAEAAQLALLRACELLPTHAEAWEHRAVALFHLARYPLARDCFERSVTLDPARVSAWSGAAKNANQSGNFAEGRRYAEAAIGVDRTHVAGYAHLAYALLALGQTEQAAMSYRRVLALAPDVPEAHFNLGSVLSDLGQAAAAADSYRKAIALKPDYMEAHYRLGIALMNQGLHADAAASARRALALKPDAVQIHNFLLFCLSNDAANTPLSTFAEHQAFGARFETARIPSWPRHTNERDAARPLRLGFVSGDLRSHPVAMFVHPVWAALDRAGYQLWVYANHRVHDDVSANLRAVSDHWLQVEDLDDDQLAARISADAIDVLFDLSGHTAHNRLLTFARKPAPLQVTWIGYPNTTGLQAMDYVLCDRFNAPHGMYEHFYSEKFARLPSSGTFTPPLGTPVLNDLPALSKGYVTFASFNRIDKLGANVIGVWCDVLQAVTGSRLLLGNVGEPALAQRIAAQFAEHGIGADRLLFRPLLPLNDYLRLHHEVDIILDTWPYSGGTTTNFALWMGVPVVSLRGPSRAHCQSAAVLGRLGMEHWVAGSEAQFVDLAVRWAGALPELAAVRRGLRERWQNAPLRQPETVARGLEQAVRHMWQRWCAGLPAEHFEIAQAGAPTALPVPSYGAPQLDRHE